MKFSSSTIDVEKAIAEMERAEKQRRKELQIWVRHKNKLIKGKKCVKCGKQADTMHHPKLRRKYDSFDEYLNEPDLKPVCHWCHHIVIHGQTPYHMLWRSCKFRNNEEIVQLPEYRQKKIIYKEYCDKCPEKKKCLAVKIGIF
ncbi:MAG: hypothetical protein JSW00_05730 [Thermoplasmata archaeon]|nr:MAG: hypothetical protein JSW00_05730 [Thermoplasmata archaeon]